MADTKKSSKKTQKEPEVSLTQYANKHNVHPGLLASFKVENGKDADGKKTESEWGKAFEEQRKRVYTYKPAKD